MNRINLAVKTLDHFSGLDLPKYATSQSAGLDLAAAIDADLVIKAGGFALVPTGLSIAIPEGYEAQVRPRSGLALKNQITVLNTPGTIDADYRGELKVILINLGTEDFKIERGMRIAQLIINKCYQAELIEVDVLPETVRGEGGFGSTGVKEKVAG
jgi:dUTP pyrophosphatase